MRQPIVPAWRETTSLLRSSSGPRQPIGRGPRPPRPPGAARKIPLPRPPARPSGRPPAGPASRPPGPPARRPPRSEAQGKSWFKLALIAVIILLAAAAGFIYYRGRASLSTTAGTVKLAGLSAAVEVLRDRYGVPHLFASSLTDLARAAGYVHAQDRLFQMDVSRRMGSGRMAELFGQSALPHDRRVRRLGLRQAAELELGRIDLEVRALLEAYAAGVNGYIEAHGGRLPPEYQILRVSPQPWSPVDSLAVAKSMEYFLAFNGSVELARAHLAERFGIEAAYLLTGLTPPALPAETSAAAVGLGLASEEPLPSWLRPGPGASNAWAVSGSRSASGKPMLASDPHLPISIPSVWYEIHLCGGGLNVAGASLPGIPQVLLGHNERIAWGVTALFADVQDHYVETLNPADPRQYAVGDGWEELALSSESIPVSGSSPVTVDIQRSRHGVVVSDQPRDGKVLALRWDSLWSGDSALAFLRLNRAASWLDFTEALRSLAGPPLGFVYADVEGNIGFFPAGEIPVRSGFDGSLPVDGRSGAFEWQGSIPHEMKPILFNPEAGYVVNANQNMVAEGSAYPLGRDAVAPYRANRIAALLSSGGLLGAADFQRIQADRYDASTEPILRQLVATSPSGESARALQELLRGWDGQMRQGAAPALYQAFYCKLLENTFKDELGETHLAEFLDYLELGYSAGIYPILDDARAPWWDDRATPATEDRRAIFERSLADAAELLKSRQGEDPQKWDWATLHGVAFEHPLGHRRPLDFIFNRGPIPFGGSTFTVANALVSLARPFQVPLGTSFRLVVDLGNVNAATSVVSTGASGHPMSPHYFDQNESWRAGSNHPLLFDRGQIEAERTAKLTLTP